MDPLKKLVNWYFTKNALPYWVVLIIDSAIVIISFEVAFYLCHGGGFLAKHFWPYFWMFMSSLPFMWVGMKFFHTYNGIIRYSSFIDLMRVVAAVLVGIITFSIIRGGLEDLGYLPDYMRLRMSGLALLMSIVGMWAIRIVAKYTFDITSADGNARRVFIYGVRQGGLALAKSMRNERPAHYWVRGFVSPDKDVVGRYLSGCHVYAVDEGLRQIIERKRIQEFFVSPLFADRFREDTALIDMLTQAGVRIKMMPAMETWNMENGLSHQQLHEVDIEDLLPRNKIQVDMNAIGSMLKGRRIMITGAAGSIGSEMMRQVAKFQPAKLILLDQAETPMHDVRLYMARNYPNMEAPTIVGSISNQTQMEMIFREHRPEYVFHAAAYKHVPMMEDNPAMAVQNNIYGTRVIADLAVKYGTLKFVMISTDKAVNPTNVMGCSKRICEIYCQSLNLAISNGQIKGVTQFVTTRFGNVLGSNGSVIPIFRDQIAKGGPVTVTHPDIIRYFMLIPEACQLVLEAGTMGHGGEIFVFDMGNPVKIVDLAKRMILLSGAQNVQIKYTGLRDGEKLYEEVLNDAESTKPTVHPKIKVAQVREYPYEEALRNEEELYKLSFTYDDMAIVKKMKEIVPEYKSKVSKYETLDK